MLFTPPSLTFILRQRLDSVCGDVLFTFLTWTHWVAIPENIIKGHPQGFVTEINDISAILKAYFGHVREHV